MWRMANARLLARKSPYDLTDKRLTVKRGSKVIGQKKYSIERTKPLAFISKILTTHLS
jgi:hypothetical protein